MKKSVQVICSLLLVIALAVVGYADAWFDYRRRITGQMGNKTGNAGNDAGDAGDE